MSAGEVVEAGRGVESGGAMNALITRPMSDALKRVGLRAENAPELSINEAESMLD